MLGVPIPKAKKPKRGQPVPPPDTRKRAELGPDLVVGKVMPYLFPLTVYPFEGDPTIPLAHFNMLAECTPLTHVAKLWLQRLMRIETWRVLALPEFHSTPALCLKNWVHMVQRRRPEGAVKVLVLTEHWSLEDALVAGLGPTLPRLEQLHLDGATELTDDSVLALTRDASQLLALNLNRCKNVMDFSLQQTARNCPKLIYVDLGQCMTTNATCRLLAQNCPNIEVLLLDWCKFVSDAGGKALAVLKKLRRLSFFQCEKVGSSAITLYGDLPALTEFNVGFCKRINDQAVISVTRGAPNLVVCNLAHAVTTDIGLECISKSCPNITDLDLSFNNVEEDAICEMAEELTLKRLSLCGIVVSLGEHGVRGLKDDCIEHVAEYQTELECFNLRFQEGLTDKACVAIAENCKKLQELVIFGLKRVKTPAVELLVKSLPVLRDINVWRTEIEPADMARLMEAFPHCNVFE